MLIAGKQSTTVYFLENWLKLTQGSAINYVCGWEYHREHIKILHQYHNYTPEVADFLRGCYVFDLSKETIE